MCESANVKCKKDHLRTGKTRTNGPTLRPVRNLPASRVFFLNGKMRTEHDGPYDKPWTLKSKGVCNGLWYYFSSV